MSVVHPLATKRIKFDIWNNSDLELAFKLWGNIDVSRYIVTNGKFTDTQIEQRLTTELNNHQLYRVQYWQIYSLDGTFMGCCGLRPHNLPNNCFEIGAHLLPEFWHQGIAKEAMLAVIEYAKQCKIAKLFAGHNPDNVSSEKMLLSLEFIRVTDQFYPPTGLYHPSYELMLS
jgi:RimJ/RimL family protein N-acetyltransferase